MEAGIALTGSEVKSVLAGNISLREGYCKFEGGELYLVNTHIAKYRHNGILEVELKRSRKLLLHKEELRKLRSKVERRGFTIVPTRIYYSNRRIKIEIGLAKGKKLYDRREELRDKEMDRSLRRVGRRPSTRRR